MQHLIWWYEWNKFEYMVEHLIWCSPYNHGRGKYIQIDGGTLYLVLYIYNYIIGKHIKIYVGTLSLMLWVESRQKQIHSNKLCNTFFDGLHRIKSEGKKFKFMAKHFLWWSLYNHSRVKYIQTNSAIPSLMLWIKIIIWKPEISLSPWFINTRKCGEDSIRSGLEQTIRFSIWVVFLVRYINFASNIHLYLYCY